MLSVEQPQCTHFLCIACFRRLYYGDQSCDNYPEFPQPELQDEYGMDPDDDKWQNYPLIKAYNEECNRLADEKEIKYANEEHLRHCPLCRC